MLGGVPANDLHADDSRDGAVAGAASTKARGRDGIFAALYLLAAALCLRGFYDAAPRYRDFLIPQGFGVSSLPRDELVFYLWYLVYSLPAIAFLSAALRRSGAARLATGLWRPPKRGRFFQFVWRPRLFLTLCALFLLLLVYAVRVGVLRDAPVADDEAAYRFIAQTLLRGRVTNPQPDPPAAFANQHIVINEKGWFGKYPLGHPLLLALGLATGTEGWIFPLLGCLSLVCLFFVGRRLFSGGVAALAVLLLLLSPHFVSTAATLLSQTSSTLLMMLGLFATLRLRQSQRPTLWALLAGAFWGLGIMVRPLPGLLFLVAVGCVVIFSASTSWGSWRRRTRLMLIAALPLAVFAGIFLAVNGLQSGQLTTSGYQLKHRDLGLFTVAKGHMSLSLAGALLRQNFWLFGWPISFLFIPWARARPGARADFHLIWALIIAEYAYRIIVPKTVVSTTGPIYVTEIVPLLALLTASGMKEAAAWIQRYAIAPRLRDQPPQYRAHRGREWVASVAMSATIVAFFSFYPVVLATMHRAGRAWKTPYNLLDRQISATGASKRALVFANTMVDPRLGHTWAYYPPNPSPARDDQVVFLRAPEGPRPAEQAIQTWRRYFPERSAWILFHDPRDAHAILRPLRLDTWPVGAR